MRTKNEILAALVGTITKENEVIVKVEVEAIVPLHLNHSTPNEVVIDPVDMAKLMVAVQPKVVVGTLHSHPECEVIALSPLDIKAAEEWGEVVSGILTYWTPEGSKRRVARYDWYYGAKPLNVELLEGG